MTPTLVFDCHGELLEGPVWHEQRLWWVDIVSGRLLHADPTRGREEAWRVAEVLGAALPATEGRWMLARRHDLALFDPASGDFQEWARFPEEPATNRLNDGKVDPSGVLWIGSMAGDAEQPTGRLYSLCRSGKPVLQRSRVTISNGLAWDPEKALFYYIDTPTRRIDIHPWRPGAGQLGDPIGAIDLSAEAGQPDGMCIDAEGLLWVAMWGGRQVLRVDPAKRVVVERHLLPVSQVTSCCFGGADLATLFITTAAIGLSEAERAAQPHAGGLFALETRTRGRPVTLFAP